MITKKQARKLNDAAHRINDIAHRLPRDFSARGKAFSVKHGLCGVLIMVGFVTPDRTGDGRNIIGLTNKLHVPIGSLPAGAKKVLNISMEPAECRAPLGEIARFIP